MKYMDLIKNEIDFLDIYISLRNEESRLVQYITRVGASKIFQINNLRIFGVIKR